MLVFLSIKASLHMVGKTHSGGRVLCLGMTMKDIVRFFALHLGFLLFLKSAQLLHALFGK